VNALVIVLVIRILSQGQLSNSKSKSSLNYFMLPWFIINCSIITLHLIQGSQGTKESNWFNTQSLIIDFIGQSTKPSKLHMVLLDFLIMLLQFPLIVITFANNHDTTNTSSTDSHTTYHHLIRADEDDWSDDDQEDSDDGETDESRPSSIILSIHSAWLLTIPVPRFRNEIKGDRRTE
jgi:hypothetical protein